MNFRKQYLCIKTIPLAFQRNVEFRTNNPQPVSLAGACGSSELNGHASKYFSSIMRKKHVTLWRSAHLKNVVNSKTHEYNICESKLFPWHFSAMSNYKQTVRSRSAKLGQAIRQNCTVVLQNIPHPSSKT
jgi:hypothetical protein